MMRIQYNIYAAYMAVFVMLFPSYGSAQANYDDIEEISEASLREDSITFDSSGDIDEIGIVIPQFVKQNHNHIISNGSDWSLTREALNNADKNPFTIIHIGDSHLQADISSGVTREMLQYDYGNAGRGIVCPFKMSGTNEPLDYSFKSKKTWRAAKIMKAPWGQTMGFTGTSIKPNAASSEFTISTRGADDYNPFSSITLFHNGKIAITGISDENNSELAFVAIPSHDYTHIDLTQDVTSVTIRFDSAGDLTLFGASLSGNRPGIFYHTIGNNGATYNTYNRIGSIGTGIAPLSPNIVIISLGTNEAFGRIDVSAFSMSIDKLVKNIKEANPSTLIVLTTPMECQRPVYKTITKKVKGKARRNRKGRKRKNSTRTIKQKVRSYSINNNILTIRNAILKYGKENGISVYDWYEVAGGAGASSEWLSDGLYGRDRVHHTHKGYKLQGYMLYEALSDALGDNNF